MFKISNFLFLQNCFTVFDIVFYKNLLFQVRETRKAVRDSELALEKIAVGHHIGQKGHELTRTKNTRSGHIEEDKNYMNMDEG